MDISGIDLFDQNTGKPCGYVRLRCSWIVVVSIYLIKMHLTAQDRRFFYFSHILNKIL